MAVLLNEQENINVTLNQEPPINTSLPDINYIPGYKVAEEERRANEVIRQSNEADRIALYEDLEYKVETDYYKGEKGDKGDPGDTGPKGDTGDTGPQGPAGQDGIDGEDGYSPTATVTKSGKIATITITDLNGTTTAQVRDGEDGQGAGDMLKATYDTNDNGIVDNAEKVNNHTVGCDVPADAVFTDTTYTAGTGIDITNGVISNTQTSAEWGNITGDIEDQTDLKPYLDIVAGDSEKETTDFTSTTIDGVTALKDYLIKGNTTQQTYTGKNLIPSEISSQTTSGLTVTKYSDGSFLLNGTTTATISRLWLFENKNIPLSAGTYTLSTNSTGTVNDTVYFVLKNTSNVEMPFTVNLKTQQYKTATLASANILQGYLYIGTGITFTNYRIYPMFTKENSMSSYEPYVGGIPSPNPDYPQPVNNVTGRQEIDVVGKNLLDYTKSVNGIIGIGSTSEELTPSENTITSAWIPCKPNTSYTISGGNNRKRWQSKDAKGNITYVADDSSTITTNATAKYVRVYYYYLSGGVNPQSITNVQLEEGSTATTYEPYIGKQYEINLGKNLLCMENGTYSRNGITAVVENGEISLNGTASGNIFVNIQLGEQLDWKNGEKYTISAFNEVANSNLRIRITTGGTFDTTLNLANKTQTITYNGEQDILSSQIAIRIENGTTLNNFKFKPMIEVGNQSTSYSLYFTPIELCKIGDYQDYIYKNNNKWYLHKEIGKLVLDGSENWSIYNDSQTDVRGFYLDLGTKAAVIPFIGLCNYYNVVDFDIGSAGQLRVNYESASITASSVYGDFLKFAINKTIANNIVDFKTWLNNNKPQLYYVLNNSTDTEITDTTLISQLNAVELLYGLNNICVTSDNLLAILKLTVYTDTLDGKFDYLNNMIGDVESILESLTTGGGVN